MKAFAKSFILNINKNIVEDNLQKMKKKSRFVPQKTNSSHRNPPEMTTLLKLECRKKQHLSLQQGKAVR